MAVTVGDGRAILRGLTIDGANSGTVGIQFVSGKSLTIQKFVPNFFQFRNQLRAGPNRSS
jgi:hypothetical protein